MKTLKCRQSRIPNLNLLSSLFHTSCTLHVYTVYKTFCGAAVHTDAMVSVLRGKLSSLVQVRVEKLQGYSESKIGLSGRFREFGMKVLGLNEFFYQNKRFL